MNEHISAIAEGIVVDELAGIPAGEQIIIGLLREIAANTKK